MSTELKVGGITVTALNDGFNYLPKIAYAGLDFDAHPGLLDSDGTWHMPTACYLVQGEGFTVLVDAGTGPVQLPYPPQMAAAAGLEHAPEFIAVGGALPDELARVGVAPADVDIVFLTHLHMDHVGWVAPNGGEPFFPNARVLYGAADWDALIAPAPEGDLSRTVMEAARAAGILEPVEGAVVEIAPGVVAHHTPGHTPGHYTVQVFDGGQEVDLLGDTVQHPLMLTDRGIGFHADADGAKAKETRDGLFDRFTGRQVALGMSHQPGLDFKRIATGEDGPYWVNA
ncbi:MBL fold metallo-hydrolase [Streptomyces sp. Act143]|uniref:MBL fold metallo-hydrolase n=1 Tax=Streptomyces sp. Act143 TaxID=2200760 RepID=UPI0015E80148|nr:MBL fold metallo-hydrolase [Streptomyces sp. Act143]